LKLNESEITTYQNLWDIAKVVLTREIIGLNTGIRREKISKINHLSFILANYKKKGKLNPK
jgi:hypothetical protein